MTTAIVKLKLANEVKEIEKRGTPEVLKRWIWKLAENPSFIVGETDDGQFAVCDGEKLAELMLDDHSDQKEI